MLNQLDNLPLIVTVFKKEDIVSHETELTIQK